MTEKKEHRVSNRSKAPYRTYVECSCGWHQMIVHRNALARRAKADAAGNRHLREVQKK